MNEGEYTPDAAALARRGLPWILPLLFAAWLALFWPDMQSLIGEWLESGAYNHGFLVAGFSAFAIWKQRAHLAAAAARPMAAGYVLIGLLGVTWLLAALANLQQLRQLAVVALASALVLGVYGWQTYRRLLFPLAILFFAVPVWDVLREPLRVMTAIVAYHGVSLLDVPILKQGFTLAVPGGTFAVEKTCSGLNYFLAALIMSTFYVYLNGLTGRRRWFFIAFSLALAVAANWLRVIVIVMVGNHTHMQHPIIHEHVTFGWYFYLVTFVPFFLMGNRLCKLERAKAPPLEQVNAIDAGTAQAMATPRAALPAILALLLLAAFPAGHVWLERGGDAPAMASGLPAIDARGWHGPRPGDWDAHYPGAHSTGAGRYTNGQSELSLFSATYYRQSQGAELINVNNSLYDKESWRLAREEPGRHVLGDGRALPYRKLYLEGAGRRRMIWYWYDIAGRLTDDPLRAKVYEVAGRLSGDRRASVFALAADYDRDPPEAVFDDFIETVFPQLTSQSHE